MMPTKLLAADRSLRTTRRDDAGDLMEWAGEIHKLGNALFADGHVEANGVVFRPDAIPTAPPAATTPTGSPRAFFTGADFIKGAST